MAGTDTKDPEKKEPSPVNLTLKQRLFIKAYIGECRGNAKAAAEKAGYQGEDHTLEVSGSRLLRNAEVVAEIERHLAERTLSGAQVLDRLTEHANGTLEHFLRFDGDLVHMDLSQESARKYMHLIKKVKTKRRMSGTRDNPVEEIDTEIELHDPQAALVHIGRYRKLFTERAPAGVSVTTPTKDGKGSVTVTGSDMAEVQMLALHNDVLAQVLIDAGVDLPGELHPPNMGGDTGVLEEAASEDD